MSDKIKIKAKCKITGKEYSTDYVLKSDFEKYKNGESVSKCFPYLSEDDKEFLTSGVAPAGWKHMYGDDEDDCDQNNQPFAD